VVSAPYRRSASAENDATAVTEHAHRTTFMAGGQGAGSGGRPDQREIPLDDIPLLINRVR
jgi:hypothetical protein